MSSTTVESRDSIEFIYCACGCGFTRQKYIVNSRPKLGIARFIKGHNNRQPKKPIEYIKCKCGCEKQLSKYHPTYKHERSFIAGHNLKPKCGSENNMYNGGRHISKEYIYRTKPDHHFAHKNGMVYEHRLVYEEYYKCCLLPWADIHHINENKHDNTIENLQLMSKPDHIKLHIVENKQNRLKEILKRLCSICNKQTSFDKTHNKYRWFCNPKDKSKWLCNGCYKKYKRGKLTFHKPIP